MVQPAVKRTLCATFLYGVNIPGGRRFSSNEIEIGIERLQPSITFLRAVGRPDSMLLWPNRDSTEDSVRQAVGKALDCPCVVLSVTTVQGLVDAAVNSLRRFGDRCEPPFHVVSDGVEYEWCLVLSSDVLPPDTTGDRWLFTPTRNAVAVTVLERRALLARKRLSTPKGTRVMLGGALVDPWKRTLERNGVSVACLTSRTLGRIAEVVSAGKALSKR